MLSMDRVSGFVPGLLLAALVAVLATIAKPALGALTGGFTLPTMVLALLFGLALNAIAVHAMFQPGLTWCVKKLLRYAIALLGLRVVFGDIIGLGIGALVTILVAMAGTLIVAILLARLLKLDDGYGALAGAANAVCGASATLAASTVVPDYPRKEADIAFTVVMANVLSTVVMLAYPALGRWIGLDPQGMALLFGGAIHDMAQVVGAGYAVSEPVGNVAVITKLFRVFLLLPVVLALGAWFAMQQRGTTGKAKVPAPLFAVVFLLLAGLNSLAVAHPGLIPFYLPVRAALNEATSIALLLAIAALGLGTSVSAILSIGWRHMAVFMGATLFILFAVLAGIMVIG